MATLRAHIVLPAELVQEIDELVGPRGRSAFLVETASKEIKRRKLLAFLESNEPAWTDENHPDLAKSETAEWVRLLRSEPSSRLGGRDEDLDPL
jgi:hypothetical protein